MSQSNLFCPETNAASLADLKKPFPHNELESSQCFLLLFPLVPGYMVVCWSDQCTATAG